MLEKFLSWPLKKKARPEQTPIPPQKYREVKTNVPLPKIGEALSKDQEHNILALYEERYRKIFGKSPQTIDMLNEFLALNLGGPDTKEEQDKWEASGERKEWKEFLHTLRGHGMQRKREDATHQELTNVLSRLLKKEEPLKGDEGLLEGDPYMDAWTAPQTHYLLVSRQNESLFGEESMLNAAAVIVNGYNTAYIPALREKFPNVVFINAMLPFKEFEKQLRKACARG